MSSLPTLNIYFYFSLPISISTDAWKKLHLVYYMILVIDGVNERLLSVMPFKEQKLGIFSIVDKRVRLYPHITLISY